MPYYQPEPMAPIPFQDAAEFPGDPTWSNCPKSDKSCREAWALCIVSSRNIYIHSAGMYSFFINYDQSTPAIYDVG